MHEIQPEFNNKSVQKDPTRFWIVFGVVILIIIIFLVAHPSFFAPSTLNTVPANINRDVAYQKHKEGVFILDVRSQEEWAEYHIPGSVLVPLEELEFRTSEIPFDQEVLVICSHSIRSRSGRNTLLEAGHTQVSSITGGFILWNKSGYPIVTGE